MARPTVLSVVIPTYQRPTWIRRAVLSIEAQSHHPVEVVAVARDTDLPTHEAIAQLQRERLSFELRRELVTLPGFMPPVRAGFAVARGDVIALMDDDAEAAPGWAAGILDRYADDTIGAVGGRCVNMVDGEGPTPIGTTSRVGYVSPLGLFIGEMFRMPTFTEPVDVDFLMGGNMSMRREIARRLEFDMSLNRNVAQGYEVDLGLQIRRMGFRILFDPKIAIFHFSAPRAQVGLRQGEVEAIQWYAFNQARVSLRRLPPAKASLSYAYRFLVGERKAPGLAALALAPLARKLGFEVEFARAAMRGRLLAAKSVLRPEPASA